MWREDGAFSMARGGDEEDMPSAVDPLFFGHLVQCWTRVPGSPDFRPGDSDDLGAALRTLVPQARVFEAKSPFFFRRGK